MWGHCRCPDCAAFPCAGSEVSQESLLLHGPFARKPKRIRTAFSPSQLLRLERAFEKNHYVVGAERKQLASSLSLSETQVSALQAASGGEASGGGGGGVEGPSQCALLPTFPFPLLNQVPQAARREQNEGPGQHTKQNKNETWNMKQ